MQYIIPTFMFLSLILGLRAVYLGHSLYHYVRINHPDKLEELCSSRSLFRRPQRPDLNCDISDPEYHRLKERAKDAMNLAIMFFLVGIVFIIICVIVVRPS